MDEMQRLGAKLDILFDRLHSIDKTLIRQEENLKDLARRTSINETNQKTFATEIEADLAPIANHVSGMNYLLKAVGVVALLATTGVGLVKLYESIKPSLEGKSHEEVSDVRPARRAKTK
jgi:hypothetical protein